MKKRYTEARFQASAVDCAARVTVHERRNWLRLLGPALLVVLLWQVGIRQLANAISQVIPFLLAVVILLIIPHVFLKVFRWRRLLESQDIWYGLWPTTLCYFGSIFIGLLTPGRVGDFVRAVYVSRDCGVSSARALSTVLADRLFDLYALLLVGGAAFLTLTTGAYVGSAGGLLGSLALLTLFLMVLLDHRVFAQLQAFGLRLGAWGQKLFAPQGWLVELRNGLLELTLRSLVWAAGLTALAYVVFFSQCILLAMALGISVGYAQVCYAVALGSLVTFVPVSISGLGTREAVIIAYLGTAGVPAETALAFSFLVFVAFYLAYGLMGAIAWWVKPLPLNDFRSQRARATAEILEKRQDK
ncbi:flippase-like domain-containing protein [Acidobacteria bacterium AH-259-D05]|nr:flippase-like domain-containing protein [Acidobacteria bacterium AH-259-D05]